MEASARRWLIGVAVGFAALLALTCLGVSVCGGVVVWNAMKGAKIEPRETLLGGTETAYLSVRVDMKEPGHAALVNYAQDKMQQFQREIASRDPNPIVPWLQSFQGGRQKFAGQLRLELLRYPGSEQAPESQTMVSVQASQMMGVFGMMGKFFSYIGKQDGNAKQENLPRGSLYVTRDREGNVSGFSFSNERLLFGNAIAEMRRVLQRNVETQYTDMPVGMEAMRSMVKGDEQPFFGFTLTPDITLHASDETGAWQYVRLVSAAGNIVAVDTGSVTASFLVADATVEPAIFDTLAATAFQRWNLTYTPSAPARREGGSVVVTGTVTGFKQAIDSFFEKIVQQTRLPDIDGDVDGSSAAP
ncbi:MAG: hypothetical protein U0V87_11285 [Acidobacteriota bacterium]